MKYFKISFALYLGYGHSAFDFCFASHQTQSNRSQPRWSDVAMKKRPPKPLEYWWIFQIVFFSVYRFVWSQCGTNNRILNASDCLIRAQKQSYRQKVQLVHFSIPLSLYDSPAEEQKTGNKGEEFFIVIIFHICIQIFKIFSLTAESMCRAEKNQLHLCRRIGSHAESTCIAYQLLILLLLFFIALSEDILRST